MEHIIRSTHAVQLNSDEMIALYEAVRMATKNGDDENHILRELFPVLSRARQGSTLIIEPD